MSPQQAKKAALFKSPSVEAVFDNYPKTIREKLMMLRSLIFEVASQHPEIGTLEENLKWGQPSYITAESKSGSILRIDQIKAIPNHYAMYFHCQTNLIETFRAIFPSTFSYQGNRAIIFDLTDKISKKELKQCILMTLTYYLNKK